MLLTSFNQCIIVSVAKLAINARARGANRACALTPPAPGAEPPSETLEDARSARAAKLAEASRREDDALLVDDVLLVEEFLRQADAERSASGEVRLT